MKELVADLVDSIDPLVLARRVAEQACLLLPNVDGAVVVVLRDDEPEVVSAHGVLAPLLGTAPPVHLTLTGCDELPGGHRSGSVLSTPLLRDSVVFGWVSIVSAERGTLDGDHTTIMAAAGRFISTLLTADVELATQLDDLLRHTPDVVEPTAHFLAALVAPRAAARRRSRAEIEDVSDNEQLRAVFQPVRNLRDMQIVGFEGLCRFADGDKTSPDQWFAKAHQVGRGADLEIQALRVVLAAARDIPRQFELAVNLSPTTAIQPAAQQLLRSAGRRITLELTEYEQVTDAVYPELEAMRRDGIRLAVDDTGAGFSNLNRILRLRPDIIKFDRELTVDVHHDPARQALATALVYFAREIGALTVAEGIENEEQYTTLRDLGIQYGQGFFLGLPQPATPSA